MSNIIDSIQLSGSSYDVRDKSATTVVEITQSDYDNLPSSAKTSNILYIITDGSVDYITSAQCQTQINNSISGKQDTLVSGTNIKTINNESLLGSGNIDIQGGGGGKAVSGGTNISVTTGETTDTINCTIPAFFHSNTVKGDIEIGSNNGVNSDYGRLVIGRRVQSRGNPYFQYSIGIGVQPDNSNNYCQLYGQNSVGIGRGFKIGSDSLYTNGINNAIAIGHNATSRNDGDITLGANTTASGNSSVAIGSGATADGAEYKMNLNNQIKVTPSNQVYIYNKDNTEMFCLQDQLGGGGSSYTAGDGIDITNDVISVTGKVDTSAITTSVTSSSTDAQVPSAKAVNDKLGGLSIVKLTQAQYDSLATKDNSTLYVIVN